MAWAIMQHHEEEWAILEIQGIDARQRFFSTSYGDALLLVQALETQALLESGLPVGAAQPTPARLDPKAKPRAFRRSA